MKLPAYMLFFLLYSFAAYAQSVDSSMLNTKPVFDNLNDALQHPDKVYRLSLKKKKLKTFPMDILKFKNLQELDLSKNHLREIPSAIGLLTSLQVLNLSGNKLEYLPDSIGELSNLKKLVVSRNNLKEIPKRIGDLHNLEVLDLWENEIAVFPDELSNLKKLKWMDLRVILLNDEDQERIRNLLPGTKIFFSPSCKCVTG